MHSQTLHQWQHSHDFRIDTSRSEQRTRLVIVITVVMMAVEIVTGSLFGSMALLADGWHMGTHAAALLITAFAYYYARKHADNPRYSFSTGKVGVLGGFTSAVVLAVVAGLMAVESVSRLVSPVAIRFDEAIGVACIGLVVNIVCAFLLENGHGHSPDHHHHDHNLKAAYLHVVADAMTSVLAIFALSAGRIAGWIWMDPVMGIVGAGLISRWSYGLLRESSRVLLDSDVEPHTVDAIRSALEADADNRVADLHVWRLGSHHLSVIVSVVTHFPRPPEHYRALLQGFDEIDHITIEINACEGETCLPGIN